METAFSIFINPLKLLVLYFIPGFLLAACLAKISEQLQRSFIRLLGDRFYLFFFGWFGTAVHELSHAAMCLFFRHKILKIRFFKIDPFAENRGYVSHSYDQNSMFQRLGCTFISIAPLFGGALVLLITATFLLPDLLGQVGDQSSFGDTFIHKLVILPIKTSIFLFSFHYAIDFQFYIFLYLLVSIGCSMHLSPTDLKNAIKGSGLFFLVAYWVMFLFALVDRGIGLHFTNLFISTASLGYTILVTAIVTAVILIWPLIGMIKMLKYAILKSGKTNKKFILNFLNFKRLYK